MESDSESNLALDNKETFTDFNEETILYFYGLDSLAPTEWIDAESEVSILLNNFNAFGSESTEDSSTTDVQNQIVIRDDADPLGIKESILQNKSQKRKTLAHANQNMIQPELSISKKEFDPVIFLKEVHRGTSYRDLESGSENLRHLVEQRTEILKNLVKNYFEQFVNSKSTVDSFYLDIQEQKKSNPSDRGTKQFNTKLESVIDMAKNLYGPILDRRNKAEKIRITLNILERWKFFFDLPRKLQECLRLRKIDNAVKNYKKGKYLIQSFTDVSDSSSQIPRSSRIPEGQQKVFDEVWSEVNITVKQIHEYLYEQLSDPSVPMKIQEKNIFNLVSLDSKGDPVSFYLNQQFQWNLRHLSSIFTEHVGHMKDIRKELHGSDGKFNFSQSQSDLRSVSVEKLLEILNVDEKPPTHLYQKMDIKRLQRDLIHLNSKIDSYETYIGNEYDCQIWVKMTKVIKTLSSVLMKFLPDYWKLCMHYIEGRYDQDSFSKKRKNETKEENDRAEKCQIIIKQMIELYSILISKILFLDKPLEDLSNKTRTIFNEIYVDSDDDDSSSENSSKKNRFEEEEEEEEEDNEFTLESQNSLEGKREIIVIPLKKQQNELIESTPTNKNINNTIRRRKRAGVIGLNIKSDKDKDDNKENNLAIDTSTTKSILYNPISHIDTIGNAAFAEADKEKGITLKIDEVNDESNDISDKETDNRMKNENEENNENLEIETNLKPNYYNLNTEEKQDFSIFSSPIKLTSMNENYSEQNENTSYHQYEEEQEKTEKNENVESSNDNNDTLFSVNFKKQMIPIECSLFVNSHPLIICYFINIILKNVSNTYNKIKALKYNKEDVILAPLHDLINDLKLRAVELISRNTIEETKTFFKYENWIMDDDIYINLRLKNNDNENTPIPTSAVSTKPPSVISSNTTNNYEKSSTTLYIKLFYNFLKFIIRTLNVITKLHTSQELSILPNDTSHKITKKTNSIYTIKSLKSNNDFLKLEDNIELHEKLMKLIETCVLKSNFALLDSLHFLSVASETEIKQIIEKEELKNPLIGASNIKLNDTNSSIVNFGNIEVLNESINSELNNVNISSATTMVDHHKKPKKKFDIKNNDIKTLVIMSNILAFNDIIFPKIQDFYETSFKCLSEQKVNELYESAHFLNGQLFEKYLKKKLIKIRVIVRNGILYSGFDWYYITVPHEVSPYITKLIIEIVKIHSQITDISRKLQDMMISEIFLNLVQDLLEAFREIDHYSVAGMLQATLETEVIHQTLSEYEKEKTSEILKQIYQRVEKNVILDENASSDVMTKMLNDVKNKLAIYQEQMALITSCFTNKNSNSTAKNKLNKI
ncbi:hypothetical protein BCR32DRAFT_265669 [Anaeromyces robustus]|uniref:Exocyst complex component EXOC2/Sec5 N-terminal domain-containing protein n=1 Tax=Anaeromyces robustus TaxID=1754192 RepID=A0A1Y1XI23_9FUNG|nr:hypothetical protein BCR32DRAFT_265669 [Anaeromyces robustus]|eukprot:ORX85395.1 hypothetical protein BCR32DRAFT_265669 [Anaeromyces robustus]